MKKLMMIAVMAVVAAISASAQTYVGGSFGYKNINPGDGEDKINTITIAPELGYNLSDKWAIGTTVDFDYTKKGDASTTGFIVAPYARYTVAHIDKIRLFLDGTVEFGTYKVKGQDANSAWGIGVKPGVAYDVNDKVSLIAHVGFFGYSDTHKFDGNKTFALGVDNTLSLGFYYNF